MSQPVRASQSSPKPIPHALVSDTQADGVRELLSGMTQPNGASLKKVAEYVDNEGLFEALHVVAGQRECPREAALANRAVNVINYMLESAFSRLVTVAGTYGSDRGGPTREAMLARAILHVMSACKKHPSQDPLFIERSPHD